MTNKMESIWFAAFITELIVAFIINVFTLVAFARNHRLRKRSTYLIINLTVADLLAGAVAGPLYLYGPEIEPKHGYSWRNIFILAIDSFFVASEANLTLIALERLHATLYPFRHCLIGKRVYYRIIVCSWFVALLLTSVMGFLQLNEPVACQYVWVTYITLTLMVLIISYVVIILKVKSSPHSQQFGSVLSAERKLSVTLFVVTVVSILTLLPWAICFAIPDDIRIQWSPAARLHIANTVNALYYANYIVNPLIYAIRLQEFRNEVKELVCKKTS